MLGASALGELPLSGQTPAFGASTSRADNSLVITTPLLSLVTDEQAVLVFAVELYPELTYDAGPETTPEPGEDIDPVEEPDPGAALNELLLEGGDTLLLEGGGL